MYAVVDHEVISARVVKKSTAKHKGLHSPVLAGGRSLPLPSPPSHSLQFAVNHLTFALTLRTVPIQHRSPLALHPRPRQLPCCRRHRHFLRLHRNGHPRQARPRRFSKCARRLARAVPSATFSAPKTSSTFDVWVVSSSHRIAAELREAFLRAWRTMAYSIVAILQKRALYINVPPFVSSVWEGHLAHIGGCVGLGGRWRRLSGAEGRARPTAGTHPMGG